MKTLVRFATCATIWLSLLVSSCTKEQNDPIPAQTHKEELIGTDLLEKLFSDKQYSRQLVQRLDLGAASKVWTWTPIWEQAVERKSPGSNLYIYIPLEPRQNIKPYVIKLEGKRRFLRFELVKGQWVVSLRSYFYKIPKGNLKLSLEKVDPAKFINTFTGDVLTQVLENGEIVNSKYINGKWQKPKGSGESNGKTIQANSYTCTDFYDCSWYLSCPRGYSPNEATVIGTRSQDYCEPPYGYTLSCGYDTQYELSASYPYQSCEGTNDDPGDNGGGVGGGGTAGDIAVDYVPAEVIQTQPSLGDYGATLRVMDGLGQVVEARVEIDTPTKDLKKVTVVVAGVVWLTKLTQNGDGTLMYYKASSDTYYFQVSITKTYSDVFSNTRTLYGEISPSSGTGKIYFP